MKLLVVLFLLLFSYNVVGQIKVDSEKYDKLIEVCNHVTFWNGKFSTTEDDHTIMISQTDIMNGSINNVAAVLVHESRHLYFRKLGIKMNEIDEETMAYIYELDFLIKIPGVEKYLIDNAKRGIVNPK